MLGVSGDRTRTNTCTLMLNRINNGHRLPVVVNTARTRTVIVRVGNVMPPHPLARGLFTSILRILNMGLVHVLVCGMSGKMFCSCLCVGTRRAVLQVSTHADSTITLTLHVGTPVFICRSVLRTRYLGATRNSASPVKNDRPSGSRLLRRSAVNVLGATLRGTVRRRSCRQTTRVESRVGRLGGGLWRTHVLCSQRASPHEATQEKDDAYHANLAPTDEQQNCTSEQGKLLLSHQGRCNCRRALPNRCSKGPSTDPLIRESSTRYRNACRRRKPCEIIYQRDSKGEI